MTSPPVFVPSWHSLAILLNFGPCSITAQPGFPRQCLVGRACVCQESGWKPGSGRWVRWTLVSWCHLNRALMTGPSCFGCAPQHLSDGGFGAHKCSAALGPCCSQSFYYSPVMKSNGADSTSSAEHGCVVPVCLRTSHRGHCCFLAQSTLPFFFSFSVFVRVTGISTRWCEHEDIWWYHFWHTHLLALHRDGVTQPWSND